MNINMALSNLGSSVIIRLLVVYKTEYDAKRRGRPFDQKNI